MNDWWIEGVVILLVSLMLLLVAHQTEAQRSPVINCKGGNAAQPLVRDFDGRLWRVDVCAVAQSDTDGAEFKSEVRQ